MTTNIDAPSGPTRAIADFAFGGRTGVVDVSRPLAWLSPEEMEIDLADPAARRFGDYELVEKIGQGGMGVVYRARQHGLERDVAVKLLSAGPWASEEFVARFRREARSAARMQHPNIVEIYEFGHRDGLNYFSMRLIEGESLAQKLTRDGPLPVKRAASLLRTVAEAMDYAHRLGVLHLDLKPANVLLTGDGVPLVADFGLARRIDAGHDGGTEISGTPSYMAPEQATLQSHPLSASTDIYGLGAVLYECLTGRPPFVGIDSHAVLERVATEAPDAPRVLRRDVPLDLEAVCLKCLAKEPAQRYAYARELADDLGRFLEGHPVHVRPLGVLQRLHRWTRREPRLAAAVGLAVCALVIGIITTSLALVLAEGQRARAMQQEAQTLLASLEAEKQRRAAQTRAERMTQLSGLMASMFPAEASEQGREAQTSGAVQWLMANLPDDDAAQAELLDELTRALLASGNRHAADSLLEQIYAQLGTAHLRHMAQTLARSDQPDHWLLAGLVGHFLPPPGDVVLGDAQLRRAVAARPDDPWTLTVAATLCDVRCAVPDAAARLAALQPDNLYAWALLAGSTAEAEAYADVYRRRGPNVHQPRLRTLLAHAAGATRWEDSIARMQLELARANRVAGVEVPSAMTTATRAFGAAGGEDRDYAAIRASWSLPMPRLQMIWKLCDPTINNPNRDTIDAATRANCIHVGRVMADSRTMPVVERVGEVMLRRLLKGTPVEAEMLERRRRYQWLHEHDYGNDITLPGETVEGRFEENLRYGELEAIRRHFDRIGRPRLPPSGWQPKDPNALRLPEERGVPTAGPAGDRIQSRETTQ